MEEQEKTRVFDIAQRLAELDVNTDSRNWPEAKLFVYEQNQPGLWAKVCLLAFGLTQNSVIRIWCLLECVNGQRRRNGLWDINLAVDLLDHANNLIERLGSHHGRYKRLKEIWAYHGALVYHAAGEFGKACRCHAASGVNSSDGSSSQLQAEYMARTASLNEAIAGSCESIHVVYALYKKSASAYLERIRPSTKDEDVRWWLNVWCHQIMYAWLINNEKPPTDIIGNLKAISKEMQPAFADAFLAIDAILLATTETLPQSRPGLPTKLAENTDWLGCQLLAYAKLRDLYKAGEGNDLLRQIVDIEKTEHGGKVFIAIARRMLGKTGQ